MTSEHSQDRTAAARDERPLSDRLRDIAQDRTTPWPEDDDVPHESRRQRDAAAESLAVGGLWHGPAGGH